MSSDEILELINKVHHSKKETFLVKIENIGYIEMSKSETLKGLLREYSDEKLREFRNWLDVQPVKYYELAKGLNIHPVKFSQMMSGHIKSTKEIGSTLDFIAKTKKLIV